MSPFFRLSCWNVKFNLNLSIDVVLNRSLGKHSSSMIEGLISLYDFSIYHTAMLSKFIQIIWKFFECCTRSTHIRTLNDNSRHGTAWHNTTKIIWCSFHSTSILFDFSSYFAHIYKPYQYRRFDCGCYFILFSFIHSFIWFWYLCVCTTLYIHCFLCLPLLFPPRCVYVFGRHD